PIDADHPDAALVEIAFLARLAVAVAYQFAGIVDDPRVLADWFGGKDARAVDPRSPHHDFGKADPLRHRHVRAITIPERPSALITLLAGSPQNSSLSVVASAKNRDPHAALRLRLPQPQRAREEAVRYRRRDPRGSRRGCRSGRIAAGQHRSVPAAAG